MTKNNENNGLLSVIIFFYADPHIFRYIRWSGSIVDIGLYILFVGTFTGEHIVTLFIGFGFAIVILIFGVDSIHNATLSSMLP